MGRPRKFEINARVRFPGTMPPDFVVIDYRWQDINQFGEYLIIPLDPVGRRRGNARWVKSSYLEATSQHSDGQHRKVYRVNAYLEQELQKDAESRNCECQCCAHIAEDIRNYNSKGEPK